MAYEKKERCPMKQIVILSDTHGTLKDEVKARLKEADVILHAGDLDTPEVAEALYAYGKDTYIVRGNNDRWLSPRLPASLTVTIEGVRFFMTHSARDVPKQLKDVDVVVCGHSHRYSAEDRSGVLWLNPGSCGWRRWDPMLTFCVMEAEEGRYHLTKVSFPPRR